MWNVPPGGSGSVIPQNPFILLFSRVKPQLQRCVLLLCWFNRSSLAKKTAGEICYVNVGLTNAATDDSMWSRKRLLVQVCAGKSINVPLVLLTDAFKWNIFVVNVTVTCCSFNLAVFMRIALEKGGGDAKIPPHGRYQLNRKDNSYLLDWM